MRKRDKDATDPQDFTGMPATSAALTPADIQSKEFNVSRFGGYRMRDVDEFLDQITESMTKLTDENQRLRSASGLPAAPSIGAPDLADTSRQADEIIESARAEAAKIVQDARAQAAVGTTAAVVAGGDTGRAAVAPFLAQERDFLQQLATLVQSHAESVKGMAKASRTKPAAAASAAATSSTAAPGTQTKAAAPAPASDSTQPMPPVKPAADPPAPAQRPEQRSAAPIRVEEPATASVGAGDADDDGGTGEGGDRSLRELFWGEE
jgi:DivIVA domain-containing protein